MFEPCTNPSCHGAIKHLNATIDAMAGEYADLRNEVLSVLLVMDGLAESPVVAPLIRRCRNRLYDATKGGAK